MYKNLLFLILIFTTYKIYGQDFQIKGTIKSASDSTGLPGASVVMENAETGGTKGIAADMEGNFNIQGLEAGEYLLKIQFIGFLPYSQEKTMANDVNLGDIYLEEETTTLQEIEIVGKLPVGDQRGDTSQFNAGAFKTAKDASTQDLVEKMPGIALIDGKIQAQGEDVEQILIDGKPFFVGDVNAALQSLPADAVSRIEIFDQLSDKALLSGFDDGERIKTINIITKPNRRKGQFGKATAGYGTDQRYLLGASVNLFNEDRRITVTGLSNNINSLNYSADPNNQGDTRTQDGIINTNTLGVNFIDHWAGKIDITGSYFFNHRKNEGFQSRLRDFVLPSDSGQNYTEDRYRVNTNADHRVNVRFDYKMNERNRILIRPRISLRDNYNTTNFLGRTVNAFEPINQTENAATSDNIDYDYYNRMFYSHKFKKPGRSITLGLNTSYHTNRDDSYRLANNIFYSAEERNEILDQYTDLDREGFAWEGRFSYTEPVGKRGQMELEYEFGNTVNDSDKRTYNFVEQTNDYTDLDTLISNTYKSQYFTHETELGYQYQTRKLRFQVEAEYQRATLQNDQFFPSEYELERIFHSFLPSARMEYKFSQNKNIEFNYRTWTNEPSVGQLQDVIDNSNPLQLRTGNPNLDQTYNNWLRTRYRAHNPETNKSFYASVQANIIHDFIANSTFIAEQPTDLGGGIILERGSQLTRPVNVAGYYNIRSYFSYGQPFELISSNINFNGGINQSRRPGLINNEVNMANTSNFRLGFSISSNINENIDFNIFTRSSYNLVENTLRPALNNNFFNQSTRLRFNWIIWEGLVFRTDLNHQVNSGLAEGFDNNFLLWNISIGKKIFRNQLGEISLNVFDLMNQNNNIRRNVTEVYVEDIQSNVLQRYFMLTFTYNLRNFSRGISEQDYQEMYNN
ncbi:TonB-dependent receptor [soil metagenome]